MSCLSNILTQIKEGKEQIIIKNQPVYLHSFDEKSKQLFTYFATTESNGKLQQPIDSLKITKIEHYLSMISKDLLDKFRIVHFGQSSYKSLVSASLVVNGFSCVQELTEDISKLIEMYNLILKPIVYRNGKSNSKLFKKIPQI